MSNNNLKSPLLQSAGIVAAVVVLILIVGSSGSSSAGGGIAALFAGLGNAILFAIGMTIAVALSITILIGIFLAAVAMSDKAEASKMYEGLKKNFAALLLTLSCTSCNDNNAIGITEEEYEAMKEELSTLQGKNNKLQATLDSVLADNAEMQNSVSSLDTDNTTLTTKVDELSGTVQTLQESEAKINELVAQLSAKVEATNDDELKEQISALEQMQSSTKIEIEAIGTRLAEVEEKMTKATAPAKRTAAPKKTTAAKTNKPRTTRTKK
ncbi:MAG: DNA repair exonuclease SbcCD ATPase subunit [Desulforhopalus sp.]|jgi:DNA repair exonuclease SbcCD ATPase subunit